MSKSVVYIASLSCRLEALADSVSAKIKKVTTLYKRKFYILAVT